MALSQAVVVGDLWEEFRRLEDRTNSLKEVVSRLKIIRGRSKFWALQGVSLEILEGETVGLIGENGSGKSTLLRCIAGILPPTKGRVLVSGEVASLIELGAGFHPELTGRDNIMVGGVLFGLSRRQIIERFDSIVSFAELERAIDQPVRAFSSGMYVRLAFSLAVHATPKILLIDEVLAVGDEAFQRKCVQKVEELGTEGVTMVFVSHDLPLVKQVCRRSILLHEGRVAADGDTPEVIDRYLALEGLQNPPSTDRGT